MEEYWGRLRLEAINLGVRRATKGREIWHLSSLAEVIFILSNV